MSSAFSPTIGAFSVLRRDVLRGQHLAVRLVELRREPFGRHVEPVADDARERDFEPGRARSAVPGSPARPCPASAWPASRSSGSPATGKPLNGTPKMSAYSGVEHAVVADGVAPPAQPAAHHLLAQQPRAERPHAEDVRHGVAVPALGEHRHGHDAADVLAELARLADRVQHLAHQVFVGQVLGVAAGEALAVLGLEVLDLVRRPAS